MHCDANIEKQNQALAPFPLDLWDLGGPSSTGALCVQMTGSLSGQLFWERGIYQRNL